MNLYLLRVKLKKKEVQFKKILKFLIFKFIFFIQQFFNRTETTSFKIKGKMEPNLDIVFFGEISDVLIDNVKKRKKIDVDLENPDVILYFSENGKVDVVNENIYNVWKYSSLIIDAGDTRIGCICVNLNEIESISQLYQKVLRERSFLKCKGANFFVSYVYGESSLVESTGKLKRLIGTLGMDYVVGINQIVKGKKDLRTITFGETHVLYSCGALRDDADTAIAYKTIVESIKHKPRVMKEGYLPIVVDGSDGTDSIRIIPPPKAWGTDTNEENAYLKIEKKMTGQRNWAETYTLKDIFEVMGETVPQKYAKLGNHTINRICSRTFEVCPGTVFFFQKQFNDKNDKHQQSEMLRSRLYFRAFFKKSLMIFSYRKLPFFIPHIVISDPREAHIKLMAWYREKFLNAEFIGITGSIGKTSTKDMLYCVLSEGLRTEKNLRNTNVQVKIGLHMQQISSDCQIFIQEIGGGRPGGASRHSRMIKPKAAVVTNIGTAHIGNYESQEELMKNKIQITEGMAEDAVLYLNGDDQLLWNLDSPCRVVYYAVHNQEADYYATDITEQGNATYFNIRVGSDCIPAKINVFGEYNVLNAVCSYAIAKQFGLQTNNIIRGLTKFETSGIRQNVVRIGGYSLFIDCYNASVESIGSSLEVLEKLKGKRKLAVIGDLTGVGELQESVNRRVAETIDKHNLDAIILYGKEAESVSKYILGQSSKIICMQNAKQLEEWLGEKKKRGDVILFKGSSKMQLDDRIDSAFGLNTSDQRYIDESKAVTFINKANRYRILPGHISFTRYLGQSAFINMESSIFGKAVKKICKGAFAGNDSITKVEVGKYVKHIGDDSFRNCRNLEEILIPESTLFIGDKAFSGCESLKRVVIKGNLLSMGRNVFKNCSSLSEIIIPEDFNPYLKRRLQRLNDAIIVKEE